MKYTLVAQRWLVEDQQAKENSVDGVGPFGLVRNKLSYAAFKNVSTDAKGVIVVAGHQSCNILIEDWLAKETYAISEGSRRNFRVCELRMS